MMAERAVEAALKAGATEAEAFTQRSRLLQIDFTDTDKRIRTTQSTGLGLRVAAGKRVGMYSTSILSESELGQAAERALGIAKAAPEDPDWRGFNKRLERSSIQRIYDPSISVLDYTDLIDRIDLALDVLRGYSEKVKPSVGTLGLVDATATVANSQGEGMERKGTGAMAYFYAKAEDEGRESTGIEFVESRFWEDVNLDGLALGAAEKAVRFLDARQMKGGEMPVVIRNKVFASILGVMLGPPINADVVQKGASVLADKRGTQIAHEGITVVDDGVMRGGMGSSVFDDEGHPTQTTPIISEGVLENFIYDSYTAQKEKVESTGNASRSYQSPPRPSTSNLILEAGTATPEELIADTRRGLYVETVIGEWLSNPVSGELNATITQGYLIEGGELTQPVKGMVLAGNWYTLLQEGIEAIASDTANSGSNYSPTVKARKLSIAGE